jgi:hypothetical protein
MLQDSVFVENKSYVTFYMHVHLLAGASRGGCGLAPSSKYVQDSISIQDEYERVERTS